MDEMIDSIRVFFYTDNIPPIYEADDEGRPERDRMARVDTLELRTVKAVPRDRLHAAAVDAARILSRAGTPMVDMYDYAELLNAYSKGYHDALGGRAAHPEEVLA